MRVFFSNRIYKKDLDEYTLNSLNKLFEDYSSLLHYCYKTIVHDARYPEIKYPVSLYKRMVAENPNTSVYFISTAIVDAKGIHKSRLALIKEQKDILHQRLSNTNKKLEDTIKYRNKLISYKQILIDKKPLVFDNKQQTFKKTPNGCISIHKGKGKSKHCIAKYDNDYLFECLYLKPEIKKLKTRIGLLTFKINKLQSKLNQLNAVGYTTKYIPAVQFGGKKLRKQGLTDSLKQQEYKQRRNCQFTSIGINDSRDGNFVFKYQDYNFTIKTKTRDMKAFDTDGEIIIPNVKFRYGQEIIDTYYLKQFYTVHNEKKKGKPITYTIEDKGLYYIIKCSLEEEVEITNYYKANGVYGIDFNFGFYSVCETDEFGSPLLMKDIHYEWFGKTTNQVKYNIEQCIKQIVELAKANHKPLVIEDLKFKGREKLKDYNSNHSKNFKSNMFCYTKMRDQLIASAKKNGIEVYLVNPMYTSLIGKEKYMPYYKRSIHQMAALAIARRAMYPDRTESIPKRYNDCSSWKEIYKIANKPLKTKNK